MSSPNHPERVVISVVHTSDLEPEVLRAARRVVDLAFAGEFGDDDWDHALGGVHAVATSDGAVVGHASVVQRQLVLEGRAHRVGYVEGVGVHPDHQRRGIAGRLMDRIEHVIRHGYEFGALGASEAGKPLYQRRGWVPWNGPLGALSPGGLVDTPEELGTVHVLAGRVAPDVTARLLCDYREGDLW